MAHEELGIRSKAHDPGCVTRHISTYIKGHNCSHRWHAAKKARAEKDIPYTDPNKKTYRRWRAIAANLAKIAAWSSQGKATAVRDLAGGLMKGFFVEPFSVVFWPWSNNAHHIIPRSTLAKVLDLAAAPAAPNDAHMFKVIVNALLVETYNLNDEPNMIMLPNEEEDAARMGLPRHLKGTGEGARDHPDYSDEVFTHTKGRVVPEYADLAAAIKAEKHQKDEKAKPVKEILNGISDATYKQIVALAKAARAQGQTDVTLDSISSGLFK